MNPVDAPSPSFSPSPSAGQMLRAAREAQGLHLAVLAVKLKLHVRLLEALEADRHEELKGAPFVRALAQSVCRQLHIDPAPVLAALPQPAHKPVLEPRALEARRHTPHTPSRHSAGKGLSRQVLALALLMLLGAAALIWWPTGFNLAGTAAEDAQDAAQAAVPLGQASDPMAMAEPAASAASAESETPVPAAAPASAPSVAPSPAPVASAPTVASSAVPAPLAIPVAATLQIRLQADTWVEVRDGQGQMAVKRTVKAGETLQLSPPAPLSVYLSKADRAEVRWQGQVVDLQPHTRNHEARLQLKP